MKYAGQTQKTTAASTARRSSSTRRPISHTSTAEATQSPIGAARIVVALSPKSAINGAAMNSSCVPP